MSNGFNADYLIESPDYAHVMDTVVLPFLDSRGKITELAAADGMRLFCEVWDAPQPEGTVLVLHGFTENAFKYSELIYSLLHCGFSVVAYDQRGHGRSGRAEGLPEVSDTHVDRFLDYVSDMKLVCDTLLADMPKPWRLFSHSMGGAVSALFLERYTDVFSAAVFCAPMIAPDTHGIPAAAASSVCRAAKAIGRDKRHPFFMKGYSGPEDFNTSCATDPARFAWYDSVKASRKEFQNSVPTYRWTQESIAVTKKILAAGAPESISIPVLLSTAENDSSVKPGPQQEFIGRVPKGRHIFVNKARHEIYRSVNDVFFPWWHQVIEFLRHPD